MNMNRNDELIQVRHPRPGDIRAIASFATDIRRETGRFEKRHQLLYKEMEITKSPRKFFLVLEYNGEVAGFVRVVRSWNPFSNIWWVEGIEIKPSLRRRGLGSYLLKEAMYSIYHRGCPKVYLEVDMDNEGGIKFYESLNFVRTRRPPLAKMGKNHKDKYVYSFDLDGTQDWINRPETGFKYMGIK